MSTATATTVELRQAKSSLAAAAEDGSLVDFDEAAVHHRLMDAAQRQLTATAGSASSTINEQLEAIRASLADFGEILERMDGVKENVQAVNENVSTVVVDRRLVEVDE